MVETEPGTAEIGLLNEKPLHADLKQRYARPGDRLEVPIDGFVVDIVREEQLIEIQTGGFSSIRDKMIQLVARHPVHLVYPIPQEKWILKLPKDGSGRPNRRKSPKRGDVHELFRELVSFPELLTRPGFSLEVIFIQEEEVRRYDGRRRWRRRGWVTEERRLLDVLAHQRFETVADMGALLPETLPASFTTADLASAISKPRWLAQKMAYCLRKMGAINAVGRKGRSILYTAKDPAPSGSRRDRPDKEPKESHRDD
jgi:hypothetical protein